MIAPVLVSLGLAVLVVLTACLIAWYAPGYPHSTTTVTITPSPPSSTIPLLTASASSADEPTNKKLAFSVVPPVYASTSSNVLVPAKKCCDTTFSLVKSNLPDGSMFISTNRQQFLEMVFIDLKGPASFYSVQLVAYDKIKRGWTVEKNGLMYRLYQTLDNQQKMYLGLALDQKTVQGFDAQKGAYATLDVHFV
jgi:hypothetical protein